MPGKNGWEVLEVMERFQPFIPVIIITARANQYERAVVSGVDALMEKPLDLPLLVETIRRLLQEAKEVPQGSTFEERTRARGKEKALLRQVQNILDRYGEAFGKSAANRFKAQITDRMNEIDNTQQREAQQERKRK